MDLRGQPAKELTWPEEFFYLGRPRPPPAGGEETPVLAGPGSIAIRGARSAA